MHNNKLKYCILAMWLTFSGVVIGNTIPSTFFNNRVLNNREMNTQKEVWKDIPNYEGLYQVSNIGNVKSFIRYPEGKILKQNLSSGYLMVNIYLDRKCKTRRIHQLVAESFLNHKPCGYKLVVNHINFNKLDNRLENLEVITSRENSSHRIKTSASKYTGVVWNKPRQKWYSYIRINGNRKYLGNFEKEIDAHNAYQTSLKCI